MDNRDKMSAGLWYGVGDRKQQKPGKHFAGGIRSLIRTRRLEKRLISYGQEKNS